MTPNALEQGKFGSLGAIFLFIFLPCMWGLGFQKESPLLLEQDIKHVGNGQSCFSNRALVKAGLEAPKRLWN